MDCKRCGNLIVGRAKQARYCSESCKKAEELQTMPSRSRRAARELAIMYKYGLSWEEYEKKHSENNGCCEICKKPISLIKSDDQETAYVDHCHTTLQVRGLLCNPCNRGLGYFAENRKHLQSALAYLDKYNVIS